MILAFISRNCVNSRCDTTQWNQIKSTHLHDMNQQEIRRKVRKVRKSYKKKLQKLEIMQNDKIVNSNDFCSFTLDVVALYDSLKIDLVLKALLDAIKKCRPHWTKNFINWLLELVKLSLKSAF